MQLKKLIFCALIFTNLFLSAEESKCANIDQKTQRQVKKPKNLKNYALAAASCGLAVCLWLLWQKHQKLEKLQEKIDSYKKQNENASLATENATLKARNLELETRIATWDNEIKRLRGLNSIYAEFATKK